MAICIQIARRKMCQSTIVKSRLIRKRRSKYHPKTFKNETQTHPKSLQIRCRNWAPEKVGKSCVPDSSRIHPGFVSASFRLRIVQLRLFCHHCNSDSRGSRTVFASPSLRLRIGSGSASFSSSSFSSSRARCD